MFSTKKDVDKHVRAGFAKLRTENERNLRGYSIAKLYARIGEHQTALHYLATYLHATPDSAQAHRLTGQCNERLQRPDKAIAAYQRSLELDPRQTDLLIDVCKLILNAPVDDATLGRPGTMRYWCELADAQHVQHQAVIDLKMRLMRRDTFTPQQLDDMLQREIVAQPQSVTLRVQYVRHLLEQRRLDEAFKYVADLEQRQHEHFAFSLDWYASVGRVLGELDARDVGAHTWSYWVLALTAAERQLFVTLTADDRRSYAPLAQLQETAGLLFDFDRLLERAAQQLASAAPSAELATACLRHYRGQLCLHAASLVYQREQLQKTHWRETQRSALPLLLLAHNGATQPAPPATSESTRALLRQWQREAAFRAVQAGRTLLAHVDANKKHSTVIANIRKICAVDKTGLYTSPTELLTQIRQYCADGDWRKTLFRVLFQCLGKDKLAQVAGSHLVNGNELREPSYVLPTADELTAHADDAQQLRPSSLALHVYLAVGGATAAVPASLSEYRCRVFDGLNATVANLLNCGAETLCQLDVDAFLWASALQAQQRLLGERDATGAQTLIGSPAVGGAAAGQSAPAVHRPFANVAVGLVSDEQSAWWTAAYRVFRNLTGANFDLAETRATIQHGLEAVRGVGTPKIDLMVCLRLGHIFAARSAECTKPADRVALDARVEALFKFAVHMIRMRSAGTLAEIRPLFRWPSVPGESTFDAECALNTAAEEAVTYIASRYFHTESYQACIDELTGVQLPFATYFVAEAYRKLEQTAGTTTSRTNRRLYVEKARDALQQTMELLDYPHIDKNHALRGLVHDDIRAVQQQLTKNTVAAAGGDYSFATLANGSGVGLADASLNDTHNESMRMRRAAAAAASDFAASRVDELKDLMTKMMDQLSLVGTRLDKIEDQLNRQPARNSTSGSGNPLEDFYLEEEGFGAVQRNAAAVVAAATAMMNNGAQNPYAAAAHYQRMQYAQLGAPPVAYPPGAGLPGLPAFNMAAQASPFGVMPPQHQPMPPHQLPYQAQHHLQQSALNLPGTPQMPHYAPVAQQHAPVTPQHAPVTAQHVPVTPQHAPITPQHAPVTPQQQHFQSPVVPTPATVKAWNPALNNAPVEKAPPVNVVITSSDPLPLLANASKSTTVSASLAASVQPTLSVTIPPHHIKHNNPIIGSEPPAAAAPPAPTAGGGFVKTPSSLAKSAAPVAATSLATTPLTSAPKTGSDDKPKANPFGALNFSKTPSTGDKPTVFGGPMASAGNTSTPAKPGPFAGFSFGASSSVASSPFGSISSGTNAFGAAPPAAAAVPSTANQTGAASKPLGGLFSGFAASSTVASSPKAASATPPKADAADNAEGDAEDEYVPTAHFEPVIALPDLVETRTGEEEEHIRFEHRAKLLRYVKDTKEWKERGIGQMKVLVNKSDANKVRLLMRREQVLKLCCNQLLAKDTKFNALGNAGTSMTWFGQDYSENELQVELLAIRFKTADVCKQFHEAILEAQRNMSESDESAAPAAKETAPPAKPAAAAVPAAPASAKSGFGDKFKAASGSWDCSGCYVTNKAGTTKCVACNGAAPGSAPAAAAAKPAAPAPAVTGRGFGDAFKPKSGTWECKGCYVTNKPDVQHCVACDAPCDDSVAPKAKPATHSLLQQSPNAPKFSFGVPMAAAGAPATAAVASAAAPTVPASSAGSFSFGTFTAMTSTSTMFGAAPATSSSAAQPAKSLFGFSLNGTDASKTAAEPPKLAAKEAFSFVFTPKSPSKPKTTPSAATATEDVSDDDEPNIEEENTTYFTPVIALPDKVDVLTGEENETVLYAHRAKLFRYADAEWKERGLGEVKILRHQQTSKLRVVMRREQVHKICLNHALTEDIEYTRKDDKSWHFIANDYTDGSVELTQFCLRFKNADIANNFKTAIDDAKQGKLTEGTATESTDDTVVVADESAEGVGNVSDEDKRLAERLKLPVTFFAQRDTAAACPGCRGCHSDDFVFAELSADGAPDSDPLPLTMPTVQRSPAKPTAGGFSFGSALAAQNDAAKPLFGAAKATTGGSLFGSQSFSPAPAKPTGASIFGNSAAPPTGVSIFGGVAASASAPALGGSIFGAGASLFGASANAPESSAASVVKPLPTKSFSFGAAFGTTPSASPFQVAALATNAPASAASGESSTVPTTSTAAATFSFKLPESTTIAAVPAKDATDKATEPVKPFSFSFGKPATDSSSSESTASLFGQEPKAPGAASASTFSFASTFGTASPEKSATDLTTTARKPVFGGAALFKTAEKTTSTGNIFGAPAATAADDANTAVPFKDSGLSFASLASTSAKEGQAPDSGATGGIFGSSGTGNIFGSGFGDLPKATDSANAAVPFKDTGLSFASLASASGKDAPAAAAGAGGFFGLSQKDTFSNLQRPSTAENGKTDSMADDSFNGGEDPNYDPHYEPIIELPDEIEVRTGEEDEEKIFGERAKLYRYDGTNREWKERGVGELKILRHKANGTYRILLRREQVFKIVLNHALSLELTIAKMQSSDKAYCWATKNYADESDGVAEQLSVRFKNGEIGERFNAAVQQCMAELRLRPQAD